MSGHAIQQASRQSADMRYPVLRLFFPPSAQSAGVRAQGDNLLSAMGVCEWGIPNLYRRVPSIIAENIQRACIQMKVSACRGRKVQPTGYQHSEYMAVGKQRNIALYCTDL